MKVVSLILLGILGQSNGHPLAGDRPNSLFDTAWQPLENDSFETSDILINVEDKITHAKTFIEKELKEWSVPGVAISIVYNNKTILAEGFGTTRVDKADAHVTPSTLFPVGSMSGPFLSLAFMRLLHLPTSKFLWKSYVKEILPWFRLQNKYAQEFTTIEDLVTMNTVFGLGQDISMLLFGIHKSEKKLVESFEDITNLDEFRKGYRKNIFNYEVLGQVIEALAMKPWYQVVEELVWKPLGMENTVARPQNSRDPHSVTFGHLFCSDKIIGPYNYSNSTLVSLRPYNDYLAGYSVFSTAADMSKFSEFLFTDGNALFPPCSILPKGFEMEQFFSPRLLATTIKFNSRFGYDNQYHHHLVGHGMDVMGNVMYGKYYLEARDYVLFDIGFKAVNGYIPSHGLGIVLMTNARGFTGKYSQLYRLYYIRRYLFGLFLDIPIDQLENQFKNDIQEADSSGWGDCEEHWFDGKPWDIPGVEIPEKTKNLLIGTYKATKAPKFSGHLHIIFKGKEIYLEYGKLSGRLIATEREQTYIWGVDIAATVRVLVSHLQGKHPHVQIQSMDEVYERTDSL